MEQRKRLLYQLGSIGVVTALLFVAFIIEPPQDKITGLFIDDTRFITVEVGQSFSAGGVMLTLLRVEPHNNIAHMLIDDSETVTLLTVDEEYHFGVSTMVLVSVSSANPDNQMIGTAQLELTGAPFVSPGSHRACKDGDGRNFGIAGKTEALECPPGGCDDFCELGFLTEFSCGDNNLYIEMHECSFLCSGGRCINPEGTASTTEVPQAPPAQGSNNQNYECTESDDGKDPKNFGVVGSSQNIFITERDECGIDSETGRQYVVEKYCTEQGHVGSEVVMCKGICQNGACMNLLEDTRITKQPKPQIEEPDIEEVDSCFNGVQNIDEEGVDCGGTCEPCTPATCQGCKTGNECYPYGTLRTNDLIEYCDQSGEWSAQLSIGEICEYGYECQYGICFEGSCSLKGTSEGKSLREKIAIWLAFVKYLLT